MPVRSLQLFAALVSLSALAGAAHAQMTVSPRGPYGAMITTPGGAQMPAYAVPNGAGGTTYVVPGQSPYGGYNPGVQQQEPWRCNFGRCQ